MNKCLGFCGTMQHHKRFVVACFAVSFILAFVGLYDAFPRDHSARQILVQSTQPVGRHLFGNWYVVQVTASNDAEAVREAKQMTGVLNAELDVPLHMHHPSSGGLPTCAPAEWFIENVGQFGGPDSMGIDTRAWGAWDKLRSIQSPNPIRIAIIDSGINVTHMRFKDVSFYAQKKIMRDAYDADDVYGHGTAVAGVIVAMLPDPTWYMLGSYRVFDATGRTNSSTLLQAMQEAVADGANIINFSGGTRQRSDAVYEFLKSYPDVLFIFSAGNSGERPPDYPAHDDHLPSVVSVSAIDQSGALTGFTNRGALLAAPGQYIFTSMDSCKDRPTLCQAAGFGFLAGTSFSAPIVAAACAGRILMHPEETAVQVRQKLLASVDVSSAYKGELITGGRVNFQKLVQLP